VIAVDRAGNRIGRSLPPVLVRRDHEPPVVVAQVRAGTLRWRARDGSTPWLRLRALLDRGGVRHRVHLGRVRLSGRAALPLGLTTWRATLVARDSSGNTAIVPLGRVGEFRRLPIGS
jgi:hypothetical protein